jgi:hypothetical protein
MSEKQAAKRNTGHEGSSARTCKAQRIRRRSRSAPAGATIGTSKQSGRAALERPRPDTGGTGSHARTIYRGRDLDAFANWFADWWLRRGRYSDPTGGNHA